MRRIELDDINDYLRNVLALDYAKSLGVPMNLIDGRPWVPTHDEAHDPFLWCSGAECSHPNCSGKTGALLTGLFQQPGITPHE